MVAGESGLGKKTLINTLFNREILSNDINEESGEFDDVETHSVRTRTDKAEIEEDGVKRK